MEPRCAKCPLHLSCNFILIDGRGAARPRYLFVGEAPGETEDKMNKVFIGESGQLLLLAIKENNLLPARLTNTVRCRPPENREPGKKEIEACKPYLMKELEDVQPEIIVALGNVALRALTGKTGILKYAGNVVGQIGTAKIFAMFHPSYVLRMPQNQFKWDMQFKELKRLGENKPVDEIPVEVVTPTKAGDYLGLHVGNFTKEIVTFDYETDGEPEGKLRCCGFNLTGRNFVVSANDLDFEMLMRSFLKSPIKKCAHNMIFESVWSVKKFGITPKNLIADPMLLHFLIDENQSHALEFLAQTYVDASPWKIEGLMKDKGWTWATVPDEVLFPYNGKDVHYTSLILKKLMPLMTEPLKKFYTNILLPMAKQCATLEYRGINIDLDWCDMASKKYDDALDKLFIEMTKFKEVQMFMKAHNGVINLNSPAQVSEIFYKYLGLKCPHKTDGGAPSSDDEALKKLKGKHPFVDLLAKYRGGMTLKNNYLVKFPRMIHQDGKVHSSFNPAFQVTCRISVKDPPSANMPRRPIIRGMVISSQKGGMIAAPDYKQLEMRILASEAGETKMIKMFSEGLDVHDETAREMFGKDFTKDQRQNSKNINFLTVYGGDEYTLYMKYGIPTNLGKVWLDKHRQVYPNIYKWMEQQHKTILVHGFIESRFGNLRRFPMIKEVSDQERERMFRQAGNFPIQCAGGVITNLAHIELEKALAHTNTAFSFTFHHVHDCILIDVAGGEEKEVEEITRRVMVQEVPKKYCPWLKVELPIDFKISKRWGGAE